MNIEKINNNALTGISIKNFDCFDSFFNSDHHQTVIG